MIFSVNLEGMLPSGLFASLGEQIQQQVLQDVADAARGEWIAAAQKQLKGSARDYIAGIQMDVKPGIATLTLNGTMPNQLENGTPAMDMHDILLGPNVPVVERGSGASGKYRKKDGTGFYRFIPFRHTSAKSGYTSGTPMGSSYESVVANAGALGKKINAAAKKLSASTAGQGGKMRYGEALPAGLAPKLKQTHAVDIYAGMIKQAKQYRPEGRAQNQYLTFRTISTGSPGWHRSAIPGMHLLKGVESFVGKVAPMAFAEFLKQAIP